MGKYKFTYKNQGPVKQLVYKVKTDDEIDSMSQGMLTNNKITGFIPVVFTQMNETKYFKYNISGQIPVKQLLEKKIKKRQLVSVFSGIIDAMISSEEYMIDTDLIILDIDYIFADISTYETKLICLPVVGSGKQASDLKLFFKNLLFSIQFDSSENTDYVAKIMNYLNGNVFSFSGFRGLLDEIKGENLKVKISSSTKTEDRASAFQTLDKTKHKEMPKEEPILKPAPKTGSMLKSLVLDDDMEEEEVSDEKQISLFYLLQHYNKENAALYKAQRAARKKSKEGTRGEKQTIQSKEAFIDMGFAVPGQEKAILNSGKQNKHVVANQGFNMEYIDIENDFTDIPQGEEMDFGDTVLLEDDDTEGTELLGTEELMQEDGPYLLRMADQERIDIDKDDFKIGKDIDYADYWIKNPAISHRHARIVKYSGEFYVIDTNSKNHTYVNDTKIPSDKEVKLENGTKIRFAKEEYEFKLF